VENLESGEEVLLAGPRTQFIDAILESLAQEGIRGRELRIEGVEPARRPSWANTPSDEVYVVVSQQQIPAARIIVAWMSRVCLTCNSVLLAKARSCQQCGTPHADEPGHGLLTS
jgi:hypothetical protein